MPYWDWSFVGASPFTSDFWAANSSGFGGNGVEPTLCVQTSPFREGNYSLVDSAGGGCLERNFHDRFATVPEVLILLQEGSFVKIQYKWEGYHNDVHNNIGGTMPTTIAAAAPEFFMHHGFVDKVWSDWQENGYSEMYFKNIATKMPATDYYPKDLLDLTHGYAGNVCVVYQDPQNNVYRQVASK